MAPLFLTAIRPELVFPSTATAAVRPELVFPSTTTAAVRPTLVFPGTATAAVRPKLVFPSTATATIACCRVRMGTDYGGLGLMRFNPASATAAIACCRVRMGTDYGGLGLLRFNPASPSMGLLRFSVKTCSKVGQDSEGSEEEVDLVMRLEYMRKWLPTPIHPEELTNLRDGETAMLSALREVAGRGYILVKDVSYRTRPVPGSPLFEALLGLGFDFLGLGTLVVYPVGLSMILVTKLDALRRIVSSACDTPLPPALTHEPDESLMGDSLDKEIVQLVKNFCCTVEIDVNAMISTN